MLLHSPALWPEISTFAQAVLSAAPAAHLWVYILIVASSMLVVLLNGKFKSGEYATDSQFDDFYYSLSTLSIFMLDFGNYQVTCIVQLIQCHTHRHRCHCTAQSLLYNAISNHHHCHKH